MESSPFMPRPTRRDANGNLHEKAHEVLTEPDFCKSCWQTWPCSGDIEWDTVNA